MNTLPIGQYPVQGLVTQYFDTPVDYIKGRDKHEAIDIVTNGAKPIFAPYNGTISKLVDHWTENMVRGYGNELRLRVEKEGTVYEDRFTHLFKGAVVQEGQKVEKGELIGYTGRTGFRKPTHIWHTHWERTINGERVDPLDQRTLPIIVKTKRMLENNREVVYVRRTNDPKERKQLWVLNHHLNEKRRVKRKHAWQVMAAFPDTRGVLASELDGFKDVGKFKPNRVAQRHPDLFKQVTE